MRPTGFGTRFAKYFREKFDREHTLTEKAEFAGYTVMDASDYFDM